MTTKKIVIIVVSVVIVLGLLVVLVAGGIIGVAFYSINNSEATKVAQEYLRTNERLKQDIGEVKSFGKFVTGNFNINNGDGTAELNLKVIGEQKTVNASVELAFRSGRQWRVTAASYKNDAGETVDLLNPYDSGNAARKFKTKSAAPEFVTQTEWHSIRAQTNSLRYQTKQGTARELAA
jgi:hypothetical protein